MQTKITPVLFMLHFTQNSEAVRRQLVARLRKHFLPSTEEDALSLASIGAKFTPSLLSAATSRSSGAAFAILDLVQEIVSRLRLFHRLLFLLLLFIVTSVSIVFFFILFLPSSSSFSLPNACRASGRPIADGAFANERKCQKPTTTSPPDKGALAGGGSRAEAAASAAQQKNMNAQKSEEECRRENEICTRLMELRERLEEQLITRLEELKGICVVEGDLTGQLPKEIYKCLLPDEMEPTVKRRVGTTFKFPQEVLTIRRQNDDNDNGNDEPDEDRQLSQLSAEIELNRRIVAAAERLAKDKSANKSVRKKRRKDLQAAAQRLRSLEKGLHRMRLSSSKPDVSSMAMADGTAAASAASIGRQSGSGFSLNSLKAWPNFYHTLRMSNNTKSCPATPRGSVPDLSMTNAAAVAPAATDNANGASDNCRRTTPSTAKKLHKMLSRDHLISNQPVVSVSISQHSEVPSSSSSSSLSGHPSSSSGISSAAPSLSSSSNLLIMAPPPVPSRRSSSGSSISAGGRPTPPHHRRGGTSTTKNSSPTESERTEAAVRQQQQQSACGNHLYANIGYQSSSPYKSAYRQCQFPTMHQQMSPPPLSAHRQPPMTSSTSFSALKDVASCRPCTSSSASSLLAAAASTQLGQIVRRLDAAHPLRVPLIVGRAGGVQSGQAHSTGSLDRRLRRVPTTTTMKLASSTTSASAICPPAFHQLPPPPLPRTTAIEELVERDQLLVTTFPAVSDRCDNGTIIQLLKASSDFARFRSISAVLDKSARGDCSEMHFPRPNDRMEALLASIHRQSRVGSIASDISTNSATPNNDGGGTTTTTTLV
ncbi:hypothetical protein GPALN_014700 [Globodera pallida]|nr:hypothetical protein GPALN_014700 [Globodera pallida]